MKKILSFVIVLAAVVMVSCGGNATKKAADATDETRTECCATDEACCADKAEAACCEKAEGECCGKCAEGKCAEGECACGKAEGECCKDKAAEAAPAAAVK